MTAAAANGAARTRARTGCCAPQADLTPAIIARAIAKRLKKLGVDSDTAARMDARIAIIDAKEKSLAVTTIETTERTPWFCSGCPHNTSTKVPEGSRAVAGIGCHYMSVWMDRSTVTFSQMGGEGVSWVGQSAFTNDKHVFSNLGDGTYYHSGLLAVRQSVAAKVNITYKILFNDAVAMTGGQPVDGTMKVPEMTRELDAEGVAKIVVVTDEPEKYEEREIAARLAKGVTVHHRDELDAIQKQFRELEGTHGHHLRPDLRHREAPPPQARHPGRPRQARDHQRAGLRRLRRLFGAEQLPLGRAGRDRVRPQAQDQPEHLQQGLLVREGLLPELHHRRGRAAEEREEGTRPNGPIRSSCRRCPSPRCRSLKRRGASSSPASAAPA